MMDMRAFSKGYEAYYQRARQQYGVEYTRCRISALSEEPGTANLVVRYSDDQGPVIGEEGPADHRSRITSSIREEAFDLVVLSVGMEISEPVRKLGRDLGIELDDYGFCHTALFNPLETSRPGIFAAGPFREPKDIPESVVEASGAAARAAGLLSPARHTLARHAEYPPERDVSAEEPRVGVFVCHCGSNIGGFLDVPGVAEYARTLPNVVHAENNLYTCSQDSIAKITERVKELGLNRVVVASCTPRTHAPLFQDSIRAAGLNAALFDMANIRNQCSWVHSHDREAATGKARDLLRMAVARAATLEPLTTSEVPVEPAALVIGGGLAGMTAALSLAEGAFAVHLLEREDVLGGNLRQVYSALNRQDPQAFLADLVARVRAEPLIQLHLGNRLVETTGFVGNFTSTIEDLEGTRREIRHGVVLVATGGREYRGDEYHYGASPRVMTGLEFESLLALAQGTQPQNGAAQRAWAMLGSRLPAEVAFLLCVGPAEKFCGRICCTSALKNALLLKRLSPETRVAVLYKDLRTYGFKESLYTDARRAGVVFVRYDDDHRPEVRLGEPDGRLEVRLREPRLDVDLALQPDLLVLSNPSVPAEGARELATLLKIPVDADGFFLEAHVKLRPVDFASEGLFMAGLAHYPKLLDETIVQAQAAAARAARVLSRASLTAGGAIAQVEAEKCVGCLTCVRACPFDVPQVRADLAGAGGLAGAAFIEPTICRGCGVCVAECPAKAITMAHYRDDQIMVKLNALMQAGAEDGRV
jgi:heterodisulfide reductase subunit A